MARQLACLPRWSRRQTSVSQRTAALAVLRHDGSTVRSSRTRWAKASAHRVLNRDREQDCVRRPLFGCARAPARPYPCIGPTRSVSQRRNLHTLPRSTTGTRKEARAGVQFRRAAMNARAAWAVVRTCTTRRTYIGEGACRADKAGRRAALCAVRSRGAIWTCSHLIGSLRPR